MKKYIQLTFAFLMASSSFSHGLQAKERNGSRISSSIQRKAIDRYKADINNFVVQVQNYGFAENKRTHIENYLSGLIHRSNNLKSKESLSDQQLHSLNEFQGLAQDYLEVLSTVNDKDLDAFAEAFRDESQQAIFMIVLIVILLGFF